MFKRFVVLMVVAVLTIGLLPTASAQEGEVWCGTDQPVNITWIAGTVGNEYPTAVALAEKYMAEACPQRDGQSGRASYEYHRDHRPVPAVLRGPEQRN